MAIPGILGRIVERTFEDVAARRRRFSRSEAEERARSRAGARRGFGRALRRPSVSDPIRFICEVKKASPSRGVLVENLNPSRLCTVYRDQGASAISVVMEPHFFQGEEGVFHAARESAPETPLLRKDFHVDEIQIWEAAAADWDAALLIVAALSPTQLKDYLDLADAFALDHVVEAADLKEAEIAVGAGARVVGVNNRDLTTFDVDLRRTETVLPLLQECGVISVSESGIHDRQTVERFQQQGVHAVLVGESLVTAEDPEAKLKELQASA